MDIIIETTLNLDKQSTDSKLKVNKSCQLSIQQVMAKYNYPKTHYLNKNKV